MSIGIVPYLETIYSTIVQAPLYHLVLEVFLVVLIVWLIFRKSYRPVEFQNLTEKEQEDLINEWQPDPLVPDLETEDRRLIDSEVYIDGKFGKFVNVEGKKCLNLATFNFLSLIDDQRIEESSKKAIGKYGVGSCGPRGFYGTVDVHLDLEKRLAEFMRCEEAILYSYGFACVASAIPAYAKRGDVIFCDRGVNFAIQKGLLASRSRVEFFKHNDMADLERLLLIQADKDKQNPKKAKVTRRFLVVEGIYMTSGDLCPLPQLMDLKWKYKVRIFIDESLSFAVLGQTGRGITEHFGIDVVDVDMICASLENSLASTGGFCVGRSYVIDHQRLSGLGYCFSASVPPLLAVAANEGLNILEVETDRFDRLKSNSELAHDQLEKLSKLRLSGYRGGPIYHLYIKSPTGYSRSELQGLLEDIVTEARNDGLVLTVSRYLIKEERFLPEPSIRVSINSALTHADIVGAVGTIENVSKSILP